MENGNKSSMYGVKLTNSVGSYIKGENVGGGHMYKDPFEYSETGICYVSDRQLAELDKEYTKRDSFINDADVVRLGLGETRFTIKALVMAVLGDDTLRLPSADIIVDSITDAVFFEADGRDIKDVIDDMRVNDLVLTFIEETKSM